MPGGDSFFLMVLCAGDPSSLPQCQSSLRPSTKSHSPSQPPQLLMETQSRPRPDSLHLARALKPSLIPTSVSCHVASSGHFLSTALIFPPNFESMPHPCPCTILQEAESTCHPCGPRVLGVWTEHSSGCLWVR